MSVIIEKEDLLDSLREAAKEADRAALATIGNLLAGTTWPSLQKKVIEKMLAAGLPVDDRFNGVVEEIKAEAQRVRDAEAQKQAKREETTTKQSATAKQNAERKAQQRAEAEAAMAAPTPRPSAAPTPSSSANGSAPVMPHEPPRPAHSAQPPKVDLSQMRQRQNATT